MATLACFPSDQEFVEALLDALDERSPLTPASANTTPQDTYSSIGPCSAEPATGGVRSCN